MLKIYSPSNLSPFDRPAIFRLEGDASQAGDAIDLLLEDTETGTLLAARRIRLDDSAAARFDAAPVLRRAMMLQPAGGPTGVAGAAGCRFRVRVSAGGAQSDEVTLICTAPKRNALTMMSQLPERRTIRRGESDVLVFYAMSDIELHVEVQTDGGVQSHPFRWTGEAGLVELRLRTEDFGAGARRIAVFANNSPMAEYEVEPPAADSLRLAWRNDAGIIEHYTFSVVGRKLCASERRSVRLADGVCTVAAEAHEEIRLASVCECAAVTDVLARIVSSPQVWVVDGETDSYVGVEVVTREVVTRSFGEPANVELTVRPSQNGVRL